MNGERDGQAVSEGARPLSTVRPRGVCWPQARCLLCGGLSGRAALCEPCRFDLPPNTPSCPVCATPSTATQACGACQRRPPPWQAATATLRYAFPVRELVRRLKFQGRLAAGAALAEAMAQGPWPVVSSRPWLVPVPLHWTRELWRGFNQATELALHLARRTGWRLLAGALRRRRRTRPQSGLGRPARRRNLARAFRWTGPCLAGRTVILVDDVLTSGATAAACARALEGSAQVQVWVAARAAEKPGVQSAISAQRS